MAKRPYRFTLTLRGLSGLTDEALDRLFEAGCDDGLFGVRDGVVFADFTRESDSLVEAVGSALRDIRAADAGVTGFRVQFDDLVTMSEIGRRLGRTREGVRQWIRGSRGPGGFPAPAGGVRRRDRVWRWAEVVTWCRATGLGIGRPGQKSKARVGADSQGDKSPVPQAGPPAADVTDEAAALHAALDLLRLAGPRDAPRLLKKVQAALPWDDESPLVTGPGPRGCQSRAHPARKP